MHSLHAGVGSGAEKASQICTILRRCLVVASVRLMADMDLTPSSEH